MGCIFELLLLPFRYIFFELELLCDLVFDAWLDAMNWIIPGGSQKKWLKITLKIIVFLFSLTLFIVFFIGVWGAITTDVTFLELWRLTIVPPVISLIQILIGVIVKYKTRKK